MSDENQDIEIITSAAPPVRSYETRHEHHVQKIDGMTELLAAVERIEAKLAELGAKIDKAIDQFVIFSNATRTDVRRRK